MSGQTVKWVPNDQLYNMIRQGWTETFLIKEDKKNNKILHQLKKLDE